jgi:signal recognition particle receptor subunit beta
MALFDATAGRIIVRIVYDGLAGAGKTTNLRQLCRFFTPVRRGEIYTPEEAGGHTMYFDWLQFEGGIVAGHRLRCELVTVPGEAELESRRTRILDTADGIVFVCDTSKRDLAAMRERLALVRSRVQGVLSVPLILQANKQDAPGAMSIAELAEALDAHDLPVVAARASDGNGVREAAVMVIRAVADHVQGFVLANGTDALVGIATTPEALYASMRGAQPRDTLPRESPAAHGNPAAIALHRADAPPDAAASSDPHCIEAPGNPPPHSDASRETATPAGAIGTDLPAPPMPDAAASAGMVWPSASGRDTLRAIENAAVVNRDDLVGRNGTDDGSGKSDTFVYQAGTWCLKTSSRRRYADADDARAALLRLARRKLALDDLLLPGTAATISIDSRGGHWLWTVAPWVTTLRGEMTAAVAARDQAWLASSLCAFADAAAQSLELLLARGLALDVHPSNFATHAGRIVYLDDDVDEAPRLITLGHALLRRVDEHCTFERAVDTYIEHIDERLGRTLAASPQARADVVEALDGARPLTVAGQAARSILLERFMARRKRA